MKYLFVLITLFLAGVSPALAADAQAIRIPVFFVTDRNLVPNKKGKVEFGTLRQYRGLCKHEPFVGVAYCVINDTEKKAKSVDMEPLGWKLIDKKEGLDGIALAEGADYAQKRAGFWEQVYSACQKMPPPNELDMFVPGYMSTFESGLRSAARLSYYSEHPILLYSWASKGKVTQYWSDEATIEWSQEHFNSVVDDLTTLSNREPSVRVRLYAHSMGNRLVLRATPMLKRANAFDEVAMICPDVDDDLVKHYASKYFERRGATIVRLYESTGDKMLRLSRFLHGGYARFGEHWEPLDLLTPKQHKVATVSAAGTNAAGASGTGSGAEEKPKPKINLPKLPPPGPLMRRMQTIDFSDIDHGTLGHRIPVELIVSLSQMNEAPPGLYFTIEQPPLKHLDADAPKPDPHDGIIKVHFKGKWKRFPVANVVRKYRPRPTLWTTKDWTLK